MEPGHDQIALDGENFKSRVEMKASEHKSTATASANRQSEPFFSKGGRDIGGKGEDIFFHRSPIQAKLSVGQPNDKYEQEADAMADKVVQRLSSDDRVQSKPLIQNNYTPIIQEKCEGCDKEEKLRKKEDEPEKDIGEDKLQRKPIFESEKSQHQEETEGIQRKCAGCEKEEKLQKKEIPGSNGNIDPNIESTLSSTKGSGSPLNPEIQSRMESSFGADFSNIRIHNNSTAVQLSEDLHAQAFTHENDIYFNSGKYDIHAPGGQQLLAHELTHTIQQGKAPLNNIQRKVKNTKSGGHSITSVNSTTYTQLETSLMDEEIQKKEEIVDLDLGKDKFPKKQNLKSQSQVSAKLTTTVQQKGIIGVIQKMIQKVEATGSLPIIDTTTIPGTWTKNPLPLSNGKDIYVYRGFARNAEPHMGTGVIREGEIGGILSRAIDTANDAVFNQVGREPILTGPNAGGVVRIKIPSALWDELVKTNNISERSYPGFSGKLNSTEIRVNSIEAGQVINKLPQDILPPDPYYDFRPGIKRPISPKPVEQPPIIDKPTEVPPAEFNVKTQYKVLNTTKVPGSNNFVSEVEVILGDGIEGLNNAAKVQNKSPIPSRLTIRITIDGNGSFIAAESAAGEKSSLIEFLARKTFESAPKTPGVSPWVRGVSWAGIILFIGITIYRYSKADPKDKPRVLAQAGGGLVTGMAGGYLVCNLVLGIETLGASLLICGFLVGIPAGIAGEAIADTIYDEATIDDDEIRAYTQQNDLQTIGVLPFEEKLKMIFSLMKGWVSDEDVKAIVKICKSTKNDSELRAIATILEPQLIHLTSIGQRTEIRFALP
jgi:hypothetical protein